MLKKQYEQIIEPDVNIDYLDIIRENREYFNSVDGDVSLTLLENNKENLNVLMNIVSNYLEHELIVEEKNAE